MRAIDHVPEGQEIFLNYGESKSDAELKAFYGYSHDVPVPEGREAASAPPALCWEKNVAG